MERQKYRRKRIKKTGMGKEDLVLCDTDVSIEFQCGNKSIFLLFLIFIQFTVIRNVLYIREKTKFIDMENTILIRLTNQKALGLLHKLEELKLIKVLEKKYDEPKVKLSEKYKGFISKDDGQELNNHIKEMRSEWNSI